MSIPTGNQNLDDTGVVVASWLDTGHEVSMHVGPSATPASQLTLNRDQQKVLAAVLYGHYQVSPGEATVFGSANVVPLDYEAGIVVYWQSATGGNLTIQPQQQPGQAVVLTPSQSETLMNLLIGIYGTPQYPDPTSNF